MRAIPIRWLSIIRIMSRGLEGTGGRWFEPTQLYQRISIAAFFLFLPQGSLTWAGLFNTYYWIDPTTRIAAVIMMQILPFADRQALKKAYRQFERGICRALGSA